MNTIYLTRLDTVQIQTSILVTTRSTGFRWMGLSATKVEECLGELAFDDSSFQCVLWLHYCL
jgi:hypothetical protein